MYALKLDKNRMTKLYHFREKKKKRGEKSSIIGIVRDAIDKELITDEEEKEIIRVCGNDYDYWDVPAYIRKRHFEREQELADLTKEN